MFYHSSLRFHIHSMLVLEVSLVNISPPRVKFFGWLLTQNRIHCRQALARKNILEDATCEICKATEESADHIFSECPFIQSFWTAIGWFPGNIAKVKELWNNPPPPPTPPHRKEGPPSPGPAPMLGNLEAQE